MYGHMCTPTYLFLTFLINFRQAAALLKLSYLDQQFKREKDELDTEMKAELEKSKEALNREMEVTLQNELKVSWLF